MQATDSLQAQYLQTMRRERCVVTVFLMNGFQMRGTVVGYDNYAVVVLADGKQNMIYKHAISTITPSVPVRFELEAI